MQPRQPTTLDLQFTDAALKALNARINEMLKQAMPSTDEKAMEVYKRFLVVDKHNTDVLKSILNAQDELSNVYDQFKKIGTLMNLPSPSREIILQEMNQLCKIIYNHEKSLSKLKKINSKSVKSFANDLTKLKKSINSKNSNSETLNFLNRCIAVVNDSIETTDDFNKTKKELLKTKAAMVSKYFDAACNKYKSLFGEKYIRPSLKLMQSPNTMWAQKSGDILSSQVTYPMPEARSAIT